MLHQYIQEFTSAARAGGIGRLNFYSRETSSRTAAVYKGELENLERAEERVLFIEGEVDGFAGSVFVENFQTDLFPEHLQKIRESAREGRRPFLPQTLADVPAPSGEEAAPMPLGELVDRLKAAERAACEEDSRVDQIRGCVFEESRGAVTLVNDAGQSITDRVSGGHFYIGLTARQGERVQMGGRGIPLTWGQYPDMEKLARQAAADAVAKLNATSYPTGTSAVVLDSRVVCELLDAFLPAFFAKNVQNHMSVLAGRLGRQVAGANIQLEEDPQLPQGLSTRRFDDEGVPTSAKAVLSEGVLKTYLYNRQSAAKEGCAPGGNGFKTNYSEEAATGYTNMVLRGGGRSQEELLSEMGDGLLITGVSGVFAGAHPASGEFSLIARGYKVRRGQRCGGVSQITIAGDFFDLLRQVRSIGCDESWLRTAVGCVRAPSLYVEALAISGEDQTNEEV